MKKEFITKDSGKRIEFKTGMLRDGDSDKPRFELILADGEKYNESMLYRWAMLMMRGAKKYASRNWEKAKTQDELDRFKESAFRHFVQWMSDENDEDHAAAIFFNVNGAEYVKNKMEVQNGKSSKEKSRSRN